jgi:D-sedoheptulose 7-phosphate isomerase
MNTKLNETLLTLGDSEFIEKYFKDSVSSLEKFNNSLNYSLLERISNEIFLSIKENGTILVCGNGGSASDCSHIFAELMGRFFLERNPIKVIDLASNSSFITAWANDIEFDTIFSRQIEAFNDNKNVVIAISTSGNSKNILNAVEVAKKYNIKTVGLTGDKKNKFVETVDYCISVPSNSTPIVQQLHLLSYHIICALIEKKLKLGLHK